MKPLSLCLEHYCFSVEECNRVAPEDAKRASFSVRFIVNHVETVAGFPPTRFYAHFGISHQKAVMEMKKKFLNLQ